jgi:protein-S-isoprenylcysteine O-methyltransferase Ste14
MFVLSQVPKSGPGAPNIANGRECASLKTNLITIAILLIVMYRLFWVGLAQPWTPAHIAGLVLMPVGLIFLVVARLQLGRAFSVQAKATQLVTSGLYARIRNPIYIFGCVALAGVILWFNRPLLLLVFLLIVPVQIWRAGKEAKILRERFGADYDEYRKKTWF